MKHKFTIIFILNPETDYGYFLEFEDFNKYCDAIDNARNDIVFKYVGTFDEGFEHETYFEKVIPYNA